MASRTASFVLIIAVALASCSDPSEPAATDLTEPADSTTVPSPDRGEEAAATSSTTTATSTSTEPPTTTTGVPTTSGPLELVSILGFRATLPAGWEEDTSDVADKWFHSYVGADSGFRARVFDRPDRTPFADVADDGPPPDLLDAAREMVALFPDEFDPDTTVEATDVGSVRVAVITSPTTADTRVTVFGPGPFGTLYLEILIWGSETEPVLASIEFVDS